VPKMDFLNLSDGSADMLSQILLDAHLLEAHVHIAQQENAPHVSAGLNRTRPLHCHY
jgi:hypothetical protein